MKPETRIYTYWTPEEEEYLKQNWQDKTDRRLARELFEITGVSRSHCSIKARLQRLGVVRGFYWSQEEIDFLTELLGEYPLKKVVQIYQKWAIQKGFKERSASAIRYRAKKLKISIRLNGSTEYITTNDFALLLGCQRSSAWRLYKTYHKELKIKESDFRPMNQVCAHRKHLRTWILENPEIIARYQQTLDMTWLLDILKPNRSDTTGRKWE